MKQTIGGAVAVFVPLRKYDENTGAFTGTLAAEEVDKGGEVFDYAGSKPYFEKWSTGFVEKTGGKSAGNLRAMHQPIAAGVFRSVTFDDEKKTIEVEGVVVDPVERLKMSAGVYTGLSIGGSAVKRWADASALRRYICDPIEGSLVDSPQITSAVLRVTKGAEVVRLIDLAKVDRPAVLAKIAAGEEPDPVDDDEGKVGEDEDDGEKPKADDAGADDPKADDEPPPEKAAEPASEALTTLQGIVEGLGILEGDPASWTLEDVAAALKATFDEMMAPAAAEKVAKAASEAVAGAVLARVAELGETIAGTLEKVTTALEAQAAAIQKADDGKGDTVAKLAEAMDAVKAQVAGFEVVIERVKKMPAPSGRPVTKALGGSDGGAGADPREAIGTLETVIRTARAAGVPESSLMEIALAAASAATAATAR